MRSQFEAIMTLLDQGSADSALRMLRNAWEPDLPSGQRIPLYSMWIRSLCDVGELGNALTLAKRAAQEFPSHPDILTALGNVHDLRDELEEARDAFALAVELDSESPILHYNLGAVLERIGQDNDAESEFKRALELDDNQPRLPEATAALGALWRRRGRIEEASALYERHLEDDPLDADMLVEQGICLSDLDRWAEALEHYQSAVSIAPELAGAWYNRGVTLYRMGKFEDAFESVEQALELEPDNALTSAVLGSWLLATRAAKKRSEAVVANSAAGAVARPPAAVGDDPSMLRGLELVDAAKSAVFDLADRAEVDLGYACLVVEEVFEGYWSSGRAAQARDVALEAGRRDLVTPHMLDTLNRADHGASTDSSAFHVAARAQVQVEKSPPEAWPAGAGGYTTELTVVAVDEDEARELTVKYLAALEPGSQLRFDVDIHREAPNVTEVDPRIAGRGVVLVNGLRDYFTHELGERQKSGAGGSVE